MDFKETPRPESHVRTLKVMTYSHDKPILSFKDTPSGHSKHDTQWEQYTDSRTLWELGTLHKPQWEQRTVNRTLSEYGHTEQDTMGTRTIGNNTL